MLCYFYVSVLGYRYHMIKLIEKDRKNVGKGQHYQYHLNSFPTGVLKCLFAKFLTCTIFKKFDKRVHCLFRLAFKWMMRMVLTC